VHGTKSITHAPPLLETQVSSRASTRRSGSYGRKYLSLRRTWKRRRTGDWLVTEPPQRSCVAILTHPALACVAQREKDVLDERCKQLQTKAEAATRRGNRQDIETMKLEAELKKMRAQQEEFERKSQADAAQRQRAVGRRQREAEAKVQASTESERAKIRALELEVHQLRLQVDEVPLLKKALAQSKRELAAARSMTPQPTSARGLSSTIRPQTGQRAPLTDAACLDGSDAPEWLRD
jgi:hypothetical protein